jgi:5,10-methylene-tetrahydrofolate dehydrogenase/methenyl tetrahydrofolate cyclohydrolase
MVADIISGKEIAETIRVELKNEVQKLKDAKNVTPGLAVILVGKRQFECLWKPKKKYYWIRSLN